MQRVIEYLFASLVQNYTLVLPHFLSGHILGNPG